MQILKFFEGLTGDEFNTWRRGVKVTECHMTHGMKRPGVITGIQVLDYMSYWQLHGGDPSQSHQYLHSSPLMGVSRQFWRILWLLTIIEVLILLPQSLPIISLLVIILFSVSFHSSRTVFSNCLVQRILPRSLVLDMLYRTVWEPVFLLKNESQKHVLIGKEVSCFL